jgi:hypothetical protein
MNQLENLGRDGRKILIVAACEAVDRTNFLRSVSVESSCKQDNDRVGFEVLTAM